MELAGLMVIALFIEAIIQVVKPIWIPGAKRLSVTELVSVVLGIVLAVLCRINLLAGLVPAGNVAVEYLFCVGTGIALGRGPSFVYDLWQRLRNPNSATKDKIT